MLNKVFKATKGFIIVYSILILFRMILYIKVEVNLSKFSKGAENLSWLGDIFASYMSDNKTVKIWLSLTLSLVFLSCFLANLFILRLTKKISEFSSECESRKSMKSTRSTSVSSEV